MNRYAMKCGRRRYAAERLRFLQATFLRGGERAWPRRIIPLMRFIIIIIILIIIIIIIASNISIIIVTAGCGEIVTPQNPSAALRGVHYYEQPFCTRIVCNFPVLTAIRMKCIWASDCWQQAEFDTGVRATDMSSVRAVQPPLHEDAYPYVAFTLLSAGVIAAVGFLGYVWPLPETRGRGYPLNPKHSSYQVMENMKKNALWMFMPTKQWIFTKNHSSWRSHVL